MMIQEKVRGYYGGLGVCGEGEREREKSKGLSSWMKGWVVFTLDSFLPVPDQ
jgi:hypothetical protein